MTLSDITKKTTRTDRAARLERPESPQMIQKTKAVRFKSAGDTRIAYCKNDAGAAQTITCYLDTDGTGEEITVYCFVAQGGANLNSVLTRLKDGDPIFVQKFGATWRCVGIPFMPSEDCPCGDVPPDVTDSDHSTLDNLDYASAGHTGFEATITAGTLVQFLKGNKTFDIVCPDKTPASAGATGTHGEICHDNDYFYVCVATNTWMRVAIATW